MPRTTKNEPTKSTPPSAIAAAEKLMEKVHDLKEKGMTLSVRGPGESEAVPVLTADADGKPAADVLRDVIEANSDRKVRVVKKDLPCELTPDELVQKAQDFRRLRNDLSEHQTHAKMVRDDLKATESRITDAIERIANQLSSAKELRSVEVEEIEDFATNVYVEIRRDTKAEIPGSKRSLTAEEREVFLKANQKELPFDAKKSDFTAPKDPLQAAMDSELAGAPSNSGTFYCAQGEKSCVQEGEHATHQDKDGNTWAAPPDLKHLREVEDDDLG